MQSDMRPGIVDEAQTVFIVTSAEIIIQSMWTAGAIGVNGMS